MRLVALILASASAVQMVHPGHQEVSIAVHVTEHGGMPVDEWIRIDAIQDENPDNWEDHHDDGSDGDWSDGDWSDDDHDDDQEEPFVGGYCDYIYTNTSAWQDVTTGADDSSEHS